MPNLAPLVWGAIKLIELPLLEVNIRAAYSILLGLICGSSMLRFILSLYLFNLYVCCSKLKKYNLQTKTLPLTFDAAMVIEEIRKKPLPKVIFAPLAALEFLMYLSTFAKEVSVTEE